MQKQLENEPDLEEEDSVSFPKERSLSELLHRKKK